MDIIICEKDFFSKEITQPKNGEDSKKLTITEGYEDDATIQFGRGWIKPDIIAKDANGRIVVIEVKNAIKNKKQIERLKLSINSLEHNLNEKVRGIICTKHIHKEIEEYITKMNLEYVEIPEDM